MNRHVLTQSVGQSAAFPVFPAAPARADLMSTYHGACALKSPCPFIRQYLRICGLAKDRLPQINGDRHDTFDHNLFQLIDQIKSLLYDFIPDIFVPSQFGILVQKKSASERYLNASIPSSERSPSSAPHRSSPLTK